MNKVLLISLLMACGVAACGKTETKTVETKVQQPVWRTGENVDKMNGKIEKWAMIDSTNKISMKFPYQGGTTASIIVFDNKHVKIYIDKGQVMCSSYSGCYIRIKFDNETATKYEGVGSSNGKSDSIFLTSGQYSDGSASRFIKKLRTSKKVLIEVEVYQEGNPVWEFNVDSFNKNNG
jgi:hypothetical protein